jgi:hypothetical protein
MSKNNALCFQPQTLEENWVFVTNKFVITCDYFLHLVTLATNLQLMFFFFFFPIWTTFNIFFIKDPFTLKENLSIVIKKSITKCPKWLIIDYGNKILLQILRVKSCNHILVVHLTNRWWHGNMKDDVIIHMASTIYNKMTWMSKILYENVTRIKSFQI